MARANPANNNNNNPQLNDADKADTKKQNEPIIEYFGEGAKDVKFTIDPNAALIRVYSDGRILTDY